MSDEDIVPRRSVPAPPRLGTARPADGLAAAADRRAFAAFEATLLARRWRALAPIAMALVALSEVAAHLTPEFPKAPLLTASMLAVLGAVWFVAVKVPSRRALGVATVAAGVTAAGYAATACVPTGGFASLQVLSLPCMFAITSALFAMTAAEVITSLVLSIGVWLVVVATGVPRPVDTTGLATALTYLVFISFVTTFWVIFQRRLRFAEFVARRNVEELHRFAVEEVLCRHLPPRYVERVLDGTHLLDAPPERRVVTVVFADIVSFTPLSDALPPEELARVMARFYDVTSTIAFEQGATIDKFIGDSVMALLGAPEPLDAREQARRALAMAGAWQRAVHDLIASGPAGGPLTLRIGIHQDAVAVGSFGGRHRTDYTVLGMGVNIAARLEQRCPPGSILISRQVYDLLDPAPAATSVGDLELKGVPRPVAAFAVGGGSSRG